MKKPPHEMDFEVLPPERDDPDPLMRLAAFLLDNAFRLPGTNRRFGLDPILGLLPGVGMA